MSESTTDINISLEPHLLSVLTPVHLLLPKELGEQLEQYVVSPTPPTIPYQVLLRLSQWSRTEEGRKTLTSQHFDTASYSMIALLAGTTTSPERNFGSFTPPKDPEEIAAHHIKERKAITYLANALLSIGCVGFAAWWAGGKTGWKQEWRALFALFSALVVGVAEAGLFLILQMHTSKPVKPKVRSARHKKIDPAPESPSLDIPEVLITDAVDDTERPESLRLRR